MQAYVEIMLVAILVVVLFQPPLVLSNFAQSVLGKALFIVLVVVVSHQFGTNAGLLAAMITIVLLNHTREGFFEKLIPNKFLTPASINGCDSNPDSPECTRGQHAAAAVPGVSSDKQGSDDGNGDMTHEQVVKKERAGEGKQHHISSYKRQKRGGNNDSEVDTQEQSSAPKPKPQPPKEEKKVEEKKVGDKKEEDKKEEEVIEEKKKEEEKGKKEKFSNYTLDNASAFPYLGSTLAAYSTNDNIMRSMRASEYAKTAPGGSTLITNHQQTTRLVNSNDPSLAGIL